MIIAILSKEIETVKTLINCLDINTINIQDNKGFTGLHYACSDGYMEIVSLSLRHDKIDINTKNIDNSAALDIAKLKKNKSIIELFNNKNNL